MPSTAALAETAAVIGEPARAAMLMSPMDKRALTATELARAAGITPQTASRHLTRLTMAGLDIDPHLGGRRGGAVFCRPCLNWSERRLHIADRVGSALCRACLDRGWVQRVEDSRARTISPAGRLALDQAFGVRLLG